MSPLSRRPRASRNSKHVTSKSIAVARWLRQAQSKTQPLSMTLTVVGLEWFLPEFYPKFDWSLEVSTSSLAK